MTGDNSTCDAIAAGAQTDLYAMYASDERMLMANNSFHLSQTAY